MALDKGTGSRRKPPPKKKRYRGPSTAASGTQYARPAKRTEPERPRPPYRGRATPAEGTEHVRATPPRRYRGPSTRATGTEYARRAREVGTSKQVAKMATTFAAEQGLFPWEVKRVPRRRPPPSGQVGRGAQSVIEAINVMLAGGPTRRVRAKDLDRRYNWALAAPFDPDARKKLAATMTPERVRQYRASHPSGLPRPPVRPPPERDTGLVAGLREAASRWAGYGRTAEQVARALPTPQLDWLRYAPPVLPATIAGAVAHDPERAAEFAWGVEQEALKPLEKEVRRSLEDLRSGSPAKKAAAIGRLAKLPDLALLSHAAGPEVAKAAAGQGDVSLGWLPVELAAAIPVLPKGVTPAIRRAMSGAIRGLPERAAAHEAVRAIPDITPKQAKKIAAQVDDAVMVKARGAAKGEQRAAAAAEYQRIIEGMRQVAPERGVVAPTHFAASRDAAETLDRYVPEQVPGEKPPKIPGLPKTVASREDFANLLDDMAGRLEAGLQFARHWYSNSGREILAATGNDVDRADLIAQLVAIYSPQKPVAPNIAIALRVLSDWEVGRGVGVGNKHQRALARKALKGEDWLAGVKPDQLPKVRRFYANLLKHIAPDRLAAYGFDGREVTVDGWMGAAFGYGFNTGNSGLTNAQFRLVEDVVQKLSDHYGIAPEEAQAAIWTSIKAERDKTTARLYADPATRQQALERAGQSFADALFSPKNTLRLPFESMSPEKAWLAALTPEQLAAHTAEYGNATLRVLHENGLVARRDEGGISFWRDPKSGEVETNPATAVEIALGDRPVMRGAKGAERAARGVYLGVPRSTRELAEGLAAAIGDAAKQDQSGWARYLNTRGEASDATAYRLGLGRSLTEDEADRLIAALPEGMHYSAGADGGIIAMDNPDTVLDRSIRAQAALRAGRKTESRAIRGELTAQAQLRATQVADAVRATGVSDVTITQLAHRGRLLNRDEYHLAISRGRRSDLFERVRRDLTEAFDEVDTAFRADPAAAARRAFDYPGSVGGIRGRVSAGLARIREESGQVGITPPWMRPRRLPEYETPSTPAAAAPEPEPPRVPPEEPPPVRPEEPPPVDPYSPEAVGKRVRGALRGSKEAREEQARLRTEEIARRAKAAEEAMVGLEGQEAIAAAMRELRGELPKIYWGGFGELDMQAWKAMMGHISGHPDLQVFEKIRASQALGKMAHGIVPQPNEVKLLSEIFGKETVQSLARERTKLDRLKRAGIQLYHLPRSMMSTFDFSAPFRQGLVTAVRHPRLFTRNFMKMFRVWGSENAYEAVMRDIVERPTWPLMKKHRLALTDLGEDWTKREEAFLSDWAEKVPVTGRGVRASSRAYNGFLNKMRADLFDSLLEKAQIELARQGHTLDSYPQADKMLDDLARVISSATGRGEFGKSKFARDLTQFSQYFLFSPRLLASRLNFLNPVWYMSLHPQARKEALQSFGSMLGMGTAIAGLAKLGGADVELDPRNPDFMKIKVGDTRFDIFGGFQQLVRYGAQIIMGEQHFVEGGEAKLNRMERFLRFFWSKSAPVPSAAVDLMMGKDFMGQSLDAKRMIISRMVPILAGDLYDLWKQGYPWQQALYYPPALFGVGVSTFAPDEGGPRAGGGGGGGELDLGLEEGGGGLELDLDLALP